MNESNEPEVPVSNYGKQRKEDWLAHLRASDDMATSAAMQAHAQSEAHRVVQAGQQGLYGHATPWELGAGVAGQSRRVGDAYGLGRDIVPPDLDAMGSTSIGPAPARRDLRNVDMPPGHQVGESPLARWARERQ